MRGEWYHYHSFMLMRSANFDEKIMLRNFKKKTSPLREMVILMYLAIPGAMGGLCPSTETIVNRLP